MPAAKPEAVRQLAEQYEPVFVFSSGEHVFPALAESYLSHVSLAGLGPPIPVSCRYETSAFLPNRAPGRTVAEPRSWTGGRRVLNAAGRVPRVRRCGATDQGPTRLVTHLTRLNNASPTLFLTFAGWSDNKFTQGNADYVRAAFSELSAAMEPSLTWSEFESLPNRPVIWVDQPTTPTVYAEIRWCEDFLRIAEAVQQANGAERNFAGGPDPDSLQRILALTYYLFFPLLDRSAPGAATTGSELLSHQREGQWEAATVFFAGTPSSTDDPSDFDFVEPPLAVALSRDRNVATSLATCRRWSEVTRDGLHPRLYVSRGRHELLFAAPEDSTGNFDGPGGGASVDTRLDTTDPGQEDFPGSEVLLIAGLVVPWPFGLVLLLLWLISLLAGLHNDQFNGAEGPPPEVDTPAGDGDGSIAAPAGSAAPGQVLADGRNRRSRHHAAALHQWARPRSAKDVVARGRRSGRAAATLRVPVLVGIRRAVGHRRAFGRDRVGAWYSPC